jgi:hypothetical protein
MKKGWLVLLMLLTSYAGNAQTLDTRTPLVTTGNAAQYKNYYLLTLLQSKLIRDILMQDAELKRLTQTKVQRLNSALTECRDAGCFTGRMKFSEEEIKTVGNRLTQLYTNSTALQQMVSKQLIPSGTYRLNKGLSPAAQLVKAWEQDAMGINHTISVYGEGQKPNYPKIDSISFNVKSKGYTTLISNFTAALTHELKTGTLFFEPGMKGALQLLEINGRTEAADFEPMTAGINQAAIVKAKTINWAKYPYTVILVPGAGPEERDVELSAEGMIRCRLAAVQYFEGMAPYIMVSGGRVHPYKTKYSEAQQMKEFLVSTLHVPANAVIAEPHARHTTTNVRNCVRLIYHMGLPMDKPALVSTDKAGINYIVNTMPARCQKELQYMPYKIGKRLTDTELEFYPLMESLQINPLEPLDP